MEINSTSIIKSPESPILPIQNPSRPNKECISVLGPEDGTKPKELEQQRFEASQSEGLISNQSPKDGMKPNETEERKFEASQSEGLISNQSPKDGTKPNEVPQSECCISKQSPKDGTEPSECQQQGFGIMIGSTDTDVGKSQTEENSEKAVSEKLGKRSIEEVDIVSEPGPDDFKKPCKEKTEDSSTVCFLCGYLVLDSGKQIQLPTQLNPPTDSIPAALKLGCSHLVHTVCIAYRYYQTEKMQCPLCEEPLDYKNTTYIENYIHHSYIEQTKLLEFIRKPIFREGPRDPINFFYRKVNGATDIDFKEAEEANLWPPFKSNEFVKRVLKYKHYDSDFLKKVAEFVVYKHECDNRCKNKCGYGDVSKMSKEEIQERLMLEHQRLVERFGMDWEDEDSLPGSPKTV